MSHRDLAAQPCTWHGRVHAGRERWCLRPRQASTARVEAGGCNNEWGAPGVTRQSRFSLGRGFRTTSASPSAACTDRRRVGSFRRCGCAKGRARQRWRSECLERFRAVSGAGITCLAVCSRRASTPPPSRVRAGCVNGAGGNRMCSVWTLRGSLAHTGIFAGPRTTRTAGALRPVGCGAGPPSILGITRRCCKNYPFGWPAPSLAPSLVLNSR
eukprot:gene17823-biopygen12916